MYPADIDNLRMRYIRENSSKVDAAGIERRLCVELGKDAESWVRLGIMKTKDKIAGATFYNYKRDALNQPTDSTLMKQGWVRRPTDRLITIGMFFQDYLSTNKNFKVYINTLYGSNLTYNIQVSVQYMTALISETYQSVEFSFRALLLDV